MDMRQIKSLDQLRRVSVRDAIVQKRLLLPEEITHVFQLTDALWTHSGNPAEPHAALTSGLCSNGFVDTLRALRYSNICHLLAQQLAQKVQDAYDGPVDWVIGSDHASAAFSHSVAIWMGAQHDFTEKGPSSTQLWKRFTIGQGETVLHVEELMTAAGTVNAVRSGLRRAHSYQVRFAPVLGVLVDRLGAPFYDGSRVISLVQYEIDTWEQVGCPLCAQGSRRVSPKAWAELTGRLATPV